MVYNGQLWSNGSLIPRTKNMINMTTDKEDSTKEQDTAKKPDEYSGMYIRGFVKITDPESGLVIVETAN